MDEATKELLLDLRKAYQMNDILRFNMALKETGVDIADVEKLVAGEISVWGGMLQQIGRYKDARKREASSGSSEETE